VHVHPLVTYFIYLRNRPFHKPQQQQQQQQ